MCLNNLFNGNDTLIWILLIIMCIVGCGGQSNCNSCGNCGCGCGCGCN